MDLELAKLLLTSWQLAVVLVVILLLGGFVYAFNRIRKDARIAQERYIEQSRDVTRSER